MRQSAIKRYWEAAVPYPQIYQERAVLRQRRRAVLRGVAGQSLPEWLKAEVGAKKATLRMPGALRIRRALLNSGLNTVCGSALCPNMGECFSHGTATFMILGDTCTRGCAFCAVKRAGPPPFISPPEGEGRMGGSRPLPPPDPGEPARIAGASRDWQLRYVVFTSVTRDDLPDGGAKHFSRVILAIKKALPGAVIEPLVPDFAGSRSSLETVLNAGPHVLAHNLETVSRLYPGIRNGADYTRSLELLRRSKSADPRILTKSGLMLGLGETDREIESAMKDLISAGCDMLTLGQYLAPSKKHCPVKRYLAPEEFEEWKMKAKKLGFKAVMSGPLVRSSYRADKLYEESRGTLLKDSITHKMQQ